MHIETCKTAQTYSKHVNISNLKRIHDLHIIRQTTIIGIAFSIIMLIFSCSTGIESTKKIRMSKEDMKLLTKTDEENLAASISGTPLSKWEYGKQFLATSDRTLYVFEPSGTYTSQESLKGKTLHYAGTENIQTADLKEECVLLFSDGNTTYRYLTGKTEAEALIDIDSSKIPLMSDITLIENWRDKLTGMTLWTKSNLWYDKDGNRTSGLKFEEITVEDVLPTTGDFPMKVKIKDTNGKEAYMSMNYTSDLADSRNFSALFFLSDPKNKYPQISAENWNLIKRSKIGIRMTKEECRLSLGNPDELESGHNTSHTMDIWQYANGTYLIFSDGILSRFRQ